MSSSCAIYSTYPHQLDYAWHSVSLKKSQIRISYHIGSDEEGREALKLFRQNHKDTWGVLKADQLHPLIAFFDMDGTLITQETSVEMGRQFLSKQLADEVANITIRSMAGEISFKENLIAKMKLFENTSQSALSAVAEACTFCPGAAELINTLHNEGLKSYLVTGGLKTLAASYAHKLNMHGFYANTASWTNRSDNTNPDWVLTGELVPPIVDGEAKAKFVRSTCKNHDISCDRAIMVGDGANDVDMAQAVGCAVGFAPKYSLVPHLHVSNQTQDHQFLSDLMAHARHLLKSEPSS